jgi:hypothetical protein
MRCVLVTDLIAPVSVLSALKESHEDLLIVAASKEMIAASETVCVKSVLGDLSSKDTYAEIPIRKGDRAVLYLEDRVLLNRVAKILGILHKDIPILILSDERLNPTLSRKPNISRLSLTRLFSDASKATFSEIEIRKKVSTLRSLFQDAGRVLILTQHDPDPDALACGLAVRTLLGRNRATSPIRTFGKVT